MRALYRASQDDQNIISNAALIELIDQFMIASSDWFSAFVGLGSGTLPWPSYQSMSSTPKENTFNALVTHFAILPYVRFKHDENLSLFHAASRKHSIPLLGHLECI